MTMKPLTHKSRGFMTCRLIYDVFFDRSKTELSFYLTYSFYASIISWIQNENCKKSLQRKVRNSVSYEARRHVSFNLLVPVVRGMRDTLHHIRYGDGFISRVKINGQKNIIIR